MRKITHNRTSSQHISKPKIDKGEINEELVFKKLKESLKIFEKIQKNFEISHKDNKTRELEIRSIIKNIVIDDYPYISDFEKRMITDQIAESSEQRMKNYKNLFNIINTALIDLRDCFNKDYVKVMSRNTKSENRARASTTNLIISNAFRLDDSDDEMCNFTESLMLENTTQHVTTNPQLPRNKTKKTKFHLTDHSQERISQNNDDTLIEYDNLIYKDEDNPIFHKAKDDIFNNRANTLSDENTIISNIYSNKNSVR